MLALMEPKSDRPDVQGDSPRRKKAPFWWTKQYFRKYEYFMLIEYDKKKCNGIMYCLKLQTNNVGQK